MTKIFIGMPVFNGEQVIKEAIESIIKQNFSDWKLLISDNCSTDGTQEICDYYVLSEKRITYFRQRKNIGSINNFKFLLDNADAQFFMWAAADDIWHPDFLRSCIEKLDNNNEYGMAFCNIVNIDTFGRIIREYPDFLRFSKKFHFYTIISYLLDPEILGKANLIYSVYRLDLIKKIWRIYPLNNDWGSDMCFVLAALARTRIIFDPRVLFFKRIQRKTDNINRKDRIVILNPKQYTFPFGESDKYINNCLLAVKNSKYYILSYIIMKLRVIRSVYNYIISNI